MSTIQSDRLVIDTRNLSKTYAQGTRGSEIHALKGPNLRVPSGSIFGFIGPNGAGKTTTIKVLLGLTPPTAGHGTIMGYDIVRESMELRKRIGYLPQSPQFYDFLTARETLRFKAQFYYRGPLEAIEKRIDEVLILVGLRDKADRPITGFSGGERQRLGIAQAMINDSDLLILDEPAAALDPLGRHAVLQVMQGLRERTTIFYSTHILDDVQQSSDWVAILRDGELLAQAPIHNLLAFWRFRRETF